ncbi:hypothetical protein RF11_14934 [Thelohanellus kitauei]|uniref:Uncharacterized protein n=1 Tax=Thelohanellus kitauei TaxID=669202 RepID=A0A0C2NIB5_THEKT|nr:hypothetical protein RF11_14934 [Thelohanellus kitauei]
MIHLMIVSYFFSKGNSLKKHPRATFTDCIGWSILNAVATVSKRGSHYDESVLGDHRLDFTSQRPREVTSTKCSIINRHNINIVHCHYKVLLHVLRQTKNNLEKILG